VYFLYYILRIKLIKGRGKEAGVLNSVKRNEEVRGRCGIAPLFLNRGTSWTTVEILLPGRYSVWKRLSESIG
jgi:hypothetical protein